MKKNPYSQKSLFANLRNAYFARAVFLCLCLTFFLAAAFPVCHFLKNVSFIEICSGSDIKVVAVEDSQQQAPDQPDHDNVQKICPYCAARSLLAVNIDFSSYNLAANIDQKSYYFPDPLLIPNSQSFLAFQTRAPPVNA